MKITLPLSSEVKEKFVDYLFDDFEGKIINNSINDDVVEEFLDFMSVTDSDAYEDEEYYQITDGLNDILCYILTHYEDFQNNLKIQTKQEYKCWRSNVTHEPCSEHTQEILARGYF